MHIISIRIISLQIMTHASFLGKIMTKTIKTSLITLALLILWMFTGIFSSDNSNEFSIESENQNQEKST